MYGTKGGLALYVIENNGKRMLVDASGMIMARNVIGKLKEFGLYPIHKILLTHSHFDHIHGVERLKKLMKDTKIDVLASDSFKILKTCEIF